jgi:hypothetical protein
VNDYRAFSPLRWYYEVWRRKEEGEVGLLPTRGEGIEGGGRREKGEYRREGYGSILIVLQVYPHLQAHEKPMEVVQGPGEMVCFFFKSTCPNI